MMMMMMMVTMMMMRMSMKMKMKMKMIMMIIPVTVFSLSSWDVSTPRRQLSPPPLPPPFLIMIVLLLVLNQLLLKKKKKTTATKAKKKDPRPVTPQPPTIDILASGRMSTPTGIAINNANVRRTRPDRYVPSPPDLGSNHRQAHLSTRSVTRGMSTPTGTVLYTNHPTSRTVGRTQPRPPKTPSRTLGGGAFMFMVVAPTQVLLRNAWDVSQIRSLIAMEMLPRSTQVLVRLGRALIYLVAPTEVLWNAWDVSDKRSSIPMEMLPRSTQVLGNRKYKKEN